MEASLFSQSDHLTLSDLYKASLPVEGAVIVLNRLISCSKDQDGNDVSQSDRNDSKNERPYKIVRGHQFYPNAQIPMTGQLLEIVSNYIPSKILQDHWVRVLGSEAYRPNFCGFGSDKLHLVQFPMKEVKPSCHVMDPAKFFPIFTKEFIGQVNCPQAAIYTKDDVRFPCVVKSTLSCGGRAVFKCMNEKDFNEALHHHEMNNIPYVINKMIDVADEYCVQFFVNKKGNCTMIGATKPMFNQRDIWAGSLVEIEKQQELRDLFRSTIEPVSEKLQSLGFFGFAGCDVILDKDANHYVVDINPRLCGSTPLLLGSFQMSKNGWKFGIMLLDWVNYEGTEEQLIGECENEKTKGEVLLLTSVKMDDSSFLRTVLAIFSSSQDGCWDIYSKLFAKYAS